MHMFSFFKHLKRLNASCRCFRACSLVLHKMPNNGIVWGLTRKHAPTTNHNHEGRVWGPCNELLGHNLEAILRGFIKWRVVESRHPTCIRVNIQHWLACLPTSYCHIGNSPDNPLSMLYNCQSFSSFGPHAKFVIVKSRPLKGPFDVQHVTLLLWFWKIQFLQGNQLAQSIRESLQGFAPAHVQFHQTPQMFECIR